MNTVVLIYNVAHCEDADCDADRTVADLVLDLDGHRGFLDRDLAESALFCCNMNHEKGTFWHPLGRSFSQFLHDAIENDLEFDTYYNRVKEKSRGGKTAGK